MTDPQFKIWIFVAFAVRLALMPFMLHGDLLFVHYFPYHLSHHAVWDIYGYFEEHYLQRGYTYYGPLVYYSIAFFQWLLAPLNPSFGAFVSGFRERVFQDASFSAKDYLATLPHSQILYQAFWMKLPYLILDSAALIVLWRLFEKDKLRKKAVLFWALSPVVIFSGAVFGQYRSLSALTLLVSLYFFLRQRPMTASFFLGLLFMMENFPFFLIVPAVLIFGKGIKHRLRLLGMTVLPYAIVMLPLAVSSKGQVWQVYLSPIVRQMATQSLFNHYSAQTVILCKLIFIAIIAALTVLLFKKRNETTSPERQFELFYASGFVSLFAMYATTTTHIHYLMWGLPFFLFVDIKGRPWPAVLSVLFFVLLFIFNSYSLGLGFWFAGKVVAASRLLFSILCLYFCFRVWCTRIVRKA